MRERQYASPVGGLPESGGSVLVLALWTLFFLAALALAISPSA